tara:strand:+ start:295 stop:1485 length:1191 start_codon:yes stop_codon:yes gene_type:complete
MVYKNQRFNYELNLFILFVFVGFFLRVWICQFGSNMDFASWQANLDLFKEGRSIYEFGNYTYATPWIYTLYILDTLSFPALENTKFVQNIPGEFYRIKIVIFLSFIDFLIFLLLFRNYSLKIGLLFFLNPISIIITGHHNQFSQYAILFGFLSILLYENKNINKRILISSLLLGISLAVKHILIFFPLWWAFKEKKIINKIIVIVVPYSIFILSFFPFLINEFQYVYENVLINWKREDGPFWGMFGPKIIHMYFSLQTLFSLLLVILGFLFVDKKLKESFYFYLMAVVIFSSMMYTQYLVIPLIALAVYWNWKFLLYTLLTFLLFLVDGDQLNLEFLRDIFEWDLRATRIAFYPIILVLFIAFLEETIGKKKFYTFTNKIIKFVSQKIRSSIKFKI